MSMPHVTTRTVRHNGKLHPKGTLLSLNATDAAHLVDHGAVTPVGLAEADEIEAATDHGTISLERLRYIARHKFGHDLVDPRAPVDLSRATREELVAHAASVHGLKLAGEPGISSSALASAKPDLTNKDTGLADPQTMTREELFAEALAYELGLPGNIGDVKLRERIIEARASRPVKVTA